MLCDVESFEDPSIGVYLDGKGRFLQRDLVCVHSFGYAQPARVSPIPAHKNNIQRHVEKPARLSLCNR